MGRQRKFPKTPIILGEIRGSNLSYVAAAATFTGLSYQSSPNPSFPGKVQIYHATNVHGLTTSPAVGSRVWVSWAGGDGVAGFQNILAVDSTVGITIDMAYAVGLGTPTVALAGTAATVAETVTVPANVMGLDRSIIMYVCGLLTASTNNKTVSTVFGSSTINLVTTAAGTITMLNAIQSIWNDGATNAQRSTGVAGGGSSANNFLTGTQDTTVDFTIGLRLTPAAANEPIRIYRAEVVLQ